MKPSKPPSSSRNTLEFACECVSSAGGYTDPWAPIAQRDLLPDGTKETLLNRLAREPKTIAQLAKELGLSQPSVHAHINDLLASELVRESRAAVKRHPFERYYEPNFPIVRSTERARFDDACEAAAGEFAATFERRLAELRRAFDQTDLAGRGWTFADVVQYCYARAQRGARDRLEARGTLPRRKMRRNGAAWLFWAEESSRSG